MALFQKNVLMKHLSLLDNGLVTEAYERYNSYFLNSEIQSNIRSSKEEQFQEGFLRELFVKVLGYTLNPSPNYNLITEQKNETNAKKADGAILVNGNVVGVIELKDGKTTDLSKVEQQAFGYKSQNKNATYVIISNFEKLRFYIDNAVEYYEFDLFHLTENEFAILYLLLAYPQIERNIPKHIKEESLSREDAVTKALYKDYSEFKRELFADILEHNKVATTEEKVVLFKKTQKLLDRLLFIFFAEDSLLLTPNTMIRIISDWEKLKELDEYKPLYERIKKYFDWLNYGHKGKDFEVFAYNGGLFKNDDVLDSLTISDDVLLTHTRKLSEYDYASEVDVNILGHIFENSLTEIEEITNQLKEGASPVISKRKKDGVFYTPQYVTKYIVENTIGKLCCDKKAEFGIVESEYFSDKKRQIATKKSLLDKLEKYRDWLKNITICDPACGSGAFLSAALQFLNKEHHLINEMQAKITGGGMAFAYFDNDILENNLYGVDINEESVEIAKLALWLRTAQPNRKLSSLNNNIKCGNSLISDPSVSGEKAFDWITEFPEVFARGGFDCVIGNPPYVRADSPGNSLEFRNYMTSLSDWETLAGKWDLYIPFIEKSIKLCHSHGLVSLIIPDAYCHAEYAKKSLDYVKKHKLLYRIDYYPNMQIFEHVGVKSIIVNYSKMGTSFFEKRVHHNTEEYVVIQSAEYPSNLRLDAKRSLISKDIEGFLLNQICYISKGIVGNSDEKNYKGEFEVRDLLSETQDNIHPKLYFEGKDIGRWRLLRQRYIEYGTERSPQRWSRKGFSEFFKGEKMVTMRSPGLIPRTILDNNHGYFNESAIGFKLWIDLKNVENKSLSKSYKNMTERLQFESISQNYSYLSLLAIMNSSFIRYELNTNRRSNIHVYPEDWKMLLIPIISIENKNMLEELASKMQSYADNIHIQRSRFLKRLQQQPNWENIKITAALEQFDTLTFRDFVKELSKQKIRLSLAQQDEWEEYFGQYKLECNTITEQISAIDKQIDRLVYQLYNLTEDEIAMIEQG